MSAACPAAAAFRQVIDEDFSYKAVKGDYVCRIAGMHGVDCDRFLKENPRDPDARARFRGSLIDPCLFHIDVAEWGLPNVLEQYRARRLNHALGAFDETAA